ncbi:MAG: hypothetical protein IKL18_08285 [Oscillospiraceae bacterium]|nr:hypothetical protein [Oscillospiraceae bacterium]
MTNFIEELYYDNIDPQAGNKNKRAQREISVLSENEDFLLEDLSDENKTRFIDYVDAWGIVSAESNLENFIAGFRLGAKFMYDTFCGEEMVIEDYLKR